MLLCIGPSFVGKTLLLRMLQEKRACPHSICGNFSTVPTVGTNIVTLEVNKNKKLKIVELGGAMAPIWKNHYMDCSGVIFVIDAGSMHQVSQSCVLLLEAMSHHLLQDKKFLIVFNKTDVPSASVVSEVKYLLRIDDICRHSSQDVQVVDSSCLTFRGLNEIAQWISQFSV